MSESIITIINKQIMNHTHYHQGEQRFSPNGKIGFQNQLEKEIQEWYKSKLKLILAKYYACDNPNCGDGAICNYCALRMELEKEIRDVD